LLKRFTWNSVTPAPKRVKIREAIKLYGSVQVINAYRLQPKVELTQLS
jgi:hypothetical protein